MAKANPFAAAAAKAGSAPAKASTKKEKNIFIVEDPEVAKAIDDFCEAADKVKSFEADKEVAKGSAEPFCRTEFIKQFASDGRQPETIKFRTPKGNTVTFVVQDRGERYEVSEEQMSTIKALIGEEKTEALLLRDMTFSFDNNILNKEGVMDKLGEKIAQLVAEKVLTEDEAAALLVAKSRTTVKKGTVEDLARICGSDCDTMEALLSALGSHASSYIKP